MENTIENNEFSLNQGTRSFGLLLQSAHDNTIEQNKFYQNQRGLYIDQSQRNNIRKNEIFQNQIGVEIWTSSMDQTFSNNLFENNVTSVISSGGKSQNNWFEGGVGNDWGRTIPLLDLDQNGVGDFPVRIESTLHQLIEENELVYLFLKSPSITLYEKMNAILHTETRVIEDLYPIVIQTEGVPRSIYLLLLVLVIGFVGLFVYKRRREV